MKIIETWKIFWLIALASTLNIIIASGVLTDNIFANTYSGQFSSEMIAKMLSIKNKYAWLNYMLVPVLLFLKTIFIALCFWIGFFFYDSKLTFNAFLRIALIAEFVSIFFSYIRTGLLYYYNFQTLTEISQFQPFTLYSIINVDNIPEYFHYPLALISIPQAIYWVVLALLLKPLISGNFWSRMGFIAKTYGLGLLVWVSIVVFLTLNLTG